MQHDIVTPPLSSSDACQCNDYLMLLLCLPHLTQSPMPIYTALQGMQKHWGVLCRHHQAYVRKLKEALRKAPELLDKDLNQLMQSVGTIGIWHPEVDQDVRNHGGGALLLFPIA